MTQPIIVSISSGLSSALTYRRALDRYGVDCVQGVFMDTLIEDRDNYRFLDEIERWGQPFIRLTDGRDPYGVATDQHIIPNQKIAPCTFKLKIEPFRRYLATQPPTVVCIGYDWTEIDRCAAVKRNYEGLGHTVDFPLLWKPYELRPYADVARNEWGIEPPAMYAQGYSHANCGGMCVKQGQGDWLRTLTYYPDRYARAETWEQEARSTGGPQADYALLRDQRGGTVKALTLRQLRERVEAGLDMQPLLTEQAPCISCGIGGIE